MANITLATIANYWKNISDWVKGTDAVSAPKVSLTGRKASFPAPSTLDQSLNVVAYGSTSITITPPAGELWRIKLFYIEVPVPAGATAGSHEVAIRQGSNSHYRNRSKAKSNYNSIIRIQNNVIMVADSLKEPSLEQSQILCLKDLIVSNSAPLILYYVNNTNATQSGTLNFGLVKEVENIV